MDMTAEPCRALFYHLTQSGLEETMQTILTRATGTGWRVMVRGTDRERLAGMDARMWDWGGEEGFFAHGMQGGPHDAAQPVLLGTGEIPAGVSGVMLLHGALCTPEEVAGLARVWVLFDGADAGQLAGARGLWTRLTEAGLAAQYWSEETGKWVMKVEKPAAT